MRTPRDRWPRSVNSQVGDARNVVTNPILIDVPEFLQTERLELRPAAAGEGPAVNAAILDSIVELQEWMSWAKPTPTVEESEVHARKSAGQFRLREDLSFRGWLRGTDILVVGSGLHRIN
jgi:hypothetical protein